MKKKLNFKKAVVLMSVLVAAYCVLAFGNLSLNPVEWNGFSRVSLMLILFGSVLYTE